MKTLYLMLALVLLPLGASAQTATTSPGGRMKEMQAQGFGAQNAKSKTPATDAPKAEGDTDPSFPGGDIFLQSYLKKKILHSGVTGTGTVVISFRVDAKGNIYGAEVTQSAGSALDTAAFNIVTGMPRWKPGLTNGQPADKPAQVTVVFTNGK